MLDSVDIVNDLCTKINELLTELFAWLLNVSYKLALGLFQLCNCSNSLLNKSHPQSLLMVLGIQCVKVTDD